VFIFVLERPGGHPTCKYYFLHAHPYSACLQTCKSQIWGYSGSEDMVAIEPEITQLCAILHEIAIPMGKTDVATRAVF
jgi:hypothetical protein